MRQSWRLRQCGSTPPVSVVGTVDHLLVATLPSLNRGATRWGTAGLSEVSV